MNYSQTTRHFALCGVMSIFALGFSNCASDDSAALVSTAGSPSGQVGATQQTAASLCGVPSALSKCDPLTGSPCDGASGETCDWSSLQGGFICRTIPTMAVPGGFCDNETAFCGPYTTCDSFLHQCTHFCCADSDCLNVPCVPGVFEDESAAMGVCVDEFAPAAAGAGGSAGSE